MKPETPRYLPLVLEHARACGLGAGLHFVEVRHDDGCALLTGAGPCDCAPDVVTGPVIDRKYGRPPNRRERRRRRRGDA